MKKNILPVIRLTVLLVLFFSGIYTAVVWSMARLVPGKGKGDFIIENGKKYYTNIGQSFTEDKYFNSRPSAVSYNAAGSGGSNKGPADSAWLQTVRNRIDTFLAHNPQVKKSELPVELVTASGSGLDPHLSPKAAMVQVKRIAATRNIPEKKLKQLVAQHIQQSIVSGPPVVNVLLLNLALDRITPSSNR